MTEETPDLEEAVKAHALVLREERAELIRQCTHRHRALLGWASIRDEQDLAAVLAQVEADMASGTFWLTRIGLAAQTDPVLVLTLSAIREMWLREFDAVTVAERLLIDQAMIALYHQQRLHELSGNLQGRVEHDFFSTEPLHAVSVYTRDKLPQFDVDQYLTRVSEELLTAIIRCHRMLASSLRLLARLRTPRRVTIHNEGQVNLANQQVNVTTPRKRGRPRKSSTQPEP